MDQGGRRKSNEDSCQTSQTSPGQVTLTLPFPIQTAPSNRRQAIALGISLHAMESARQITSVKLLDTRRIPNLALSMSLLMGRAPRCRTRTQVQVYV
jgi:hypothetical protein